MAAYTLVITSDKLQVLGESGTYSELTLPTGVYFTGQPARVARLKNRLVITTAVTVPIWIGSDLVPRILALPTRDQIEAQVNTQLIVEHYSR